MIKNHREIYQLILGEINKDYIRLYNEDLIKIINKKAFQDYLDTIVLKNKYDALSLMELLYPLYKKYWDISEMEWLNYIYDWTLNLSFPEKNQREFDEGLEALVLFYLNLLRIFSKYEKEQDENNFLYKYPISFLNESEEKNTKYPREYLNFKKAFLDNWIYELMKLDLCITGHNTIEHVVGVNHLSLNIARQLKALNLPVDLGIVAGSGLGHDIGKYGVPNEENHRVPYLHYYYTEQWFNKIQAGKTGHIATNHSTWDLELENLPLESLILIYADFRVKNKIKNGKYTMHIFTLEEAYNIILNKLDNLDYKKEKRYEKVYRKLKDFEDFMISLGVDTSLSKGLNPIIIDIPFSLMENEEIVDNLKYFAIEHNIDLMAKLMDDNSFNDILEAARSEYNWRKLRLYLQIFKEYSTYLTQKQKMTTLYFMMDLLFHKEEDIRKEAAELIGILISHYDEEYRKEIPQSIDRKSPKTTSDFLLEELLDYMLFPNHKIEDSIIEWQYNLKTVIKSLFYNSNIANYEMYSNVLIKYYNNYKNISPIGQLYLSQTIKYIPIYYLNQEHLEYFQDYILSQLNSNFLEIRLTTLDIIDEIYRELWDSIRFKTMLKNWILENMEASLAPAENYLKYKIANKLNMESNTLNILQNNYKKDEENVSEIFLKNLKTATDWMNKKINIDILYDQVKKSPRTIGLHTGMHFCNLLKVSAVEKVRNYAGHTLLNIFEFLSLEERNDIAVELLRALEMQNYQFTKYIPDYLGQLILYLQPTELDEVINDFEIKIKQSNTQIVFLLLKTTGICIENYPKYKHRFAEDGKAYEERFHRLLGILLSGMASYDKEIKTEAFRIIGSQIFDSDKLLLKEKSYIFSLIGKKMLTLLPQKEEDKFLFLNNSASLNHVYRFILDYEFYHGSIKMPIKNKVAFFPGSFDPFSISHKEIALEIRDLGFEVYMAVDEFSWSKRTQPHKFRRDIINMTIAHEQDIFLFPSENPINISNDEDLLNLKEMFPNRKVYIVVGTDVLVNASAYDKNGILNELPHIVFDRKSQQSKEDEDLILEKRFRNLKDEVYYLSLPPQYEDISSTQIRENIDLNRDISMQIDPLVQQYIYKYGLYLREPQYKSLVQTKTIEIEVVENLNEEIINSLNKEFGHEIYIQSLYELRKKLDHRILLVKDVGNNSILGFSCLYWVPSRMLFEEFNNRDITEYLRIYSKGKLMVLSGIYTKYTDDYLIETVLNETLAYSLSSEYNYAIFKNSLSHKSRKDLEENLRIQGFIETPFNYNNSPIFMVDMNNPITLNQDLENLLKPPFDTNSEIQKVIRKTRKDLKKALSNLYPGQLLISFNRDMIYSKLIQKICDANQVPIVQDKIRTLGPNICVPFGSILNSTILPNTVTKTMHTEKIFNPSITDFTIAAYPNYLSLENQSKVFYSFNRPMILVDDLLHKGYRLNVVEPILKSANIDIDKVIVGILTGRGKEIADIKNLSVDAAYFVPNLKLWFNESSQYPFIGGDMVYREGSEQDNLIPSINLILPYASPSFIKRTSAEAIYELSKTCLINAIKIFTIIEKTYQDINEKNLIMKNLGEVLSAPRRPDTYKSMDYYENQKVSACLEGDLEHLTRIKNIIHKDKDLYFRK